MPKDNLPLPGTDSPHSEKTILVVEDNAGNFLLIAKMLEQVGITCLWKTSGYEVVEFAESLPSLDLIFMDIRLPYEDGYSAFRKLRSNKRFSKLPIVAITAVTGVDQMHAAQLAGFNGFIGKPLNPDKFPEQVLRILSGKPVWEVN